MGIVTASADPEAAPGPELVLSQNRSSQREGTVLWEYGRDHRAGECCGTRREIGPDQSEACTGSQFSRDGLQQGADRVLTRVPGVNPRLFQQSQARAVVVQKELFRWPGANVWPRHPRV